MKKRLYLEDNLQIQVARYLDYNNLLWCHVANERKTSNIQGKRLKAKGVKSGVPDCMIFNSNSVYNGLAIELKIRPNKTSDNQKEWLESLKKQGWLTCVCYCIDDVVKVVKDYLLIT